MFPEWLFSDWDPAYWIQVANPWVLQRGTWALPWFAVALQPLRLVGRDVAVVVILLAGAVVTIRLGQQLGLSRGRLAMVLLSPPLLWGAFMGQADALLMGAYLLPPALSVAVALVKPQATLGAGWQAVRRDPRVIAVAVALLLSAWLIWSWPLAIEQAELGGALQSDALPGGTGIAGLWQALFVARTLSVWDLLFGNVWNRSLWNWSPWPLGLLLLPLLFVRDRRGPLFASPFLFPYASVQSFIGPALVCATLPLWAFVLIWAGSWLRWALMLGLLRG